LQDGVDRALCVAALFLLMRVWRNWQTHQI
jgi:hypothetical protein